MAGGAVRDPDDDLTMDVRGARALAARIAEAKRRRHLQGAASNRSNQRCVDCGGEIAEVLAALGAVRCHDCRASRRVV
jgi:DNA-directed RNA polymerase subunit RPC12/RpoP